MSGGPEETLPKEFGKYRLLRKLATGGMAEIFLAERRQGVGEPLVIKRILPHLIESAEFVSMFLDEARIAARLRHEHVVEIYDIGQIEGAYFIAMEYVHGEDIRQIYNQAYKLQRSLPLSHTIRVVAESALGLGYAHELMDDLTRRPLGVVHRDVSPQNILVTYEGRAKVVDFGIARAVNKVNQTRAGVLKGKYSYMSPEQAMGEPIDARTDIFALGIILYETTTGTRLFKRHNELATLQAVIKAEVTPPSEVLTGYPVELEEIVLEALSKDPETRFQRAEDLGHALFEFLESSGLYVEPEVIADFMRELFADRLEEERTTGVPAFADSSELAAEMEPTGTVEVVGLSDEEIALADTIFRDRSGELFDKLDITGAEDSPESGPPTQEHSERSLPTPRSDTILSGDLDEQPLSAPGFADDFSRSELDGGTIAEEASAEVLEVRAREMNARVTEPEGSRTGHEPAPGTLLDESPPEMSIPPEPTHAGPPKQTIEVPDDMQPTVALQEAHGEPFGEVEPESSVRMHRDGEQTEQVRAQRTPKPAAGPKFAAGAKSNPPKAAMADAGTEPTLAKQRVPAGPRPRPRATGPTGPNGPTEKASSGGALWVALVIGMGILAMVAGFWVSGGSSVVQAPSGSPAPTGVPAPVVEDAHAEIRVLTEPGAEVLIDGEVVGRADGSGKAGPFAVPASAKALTVADTARHFERSREIEIVGGKVYEFEVRARQGHLGLAVAPWARVEVDGMEVGITPLRELLLVEGSHEVVLTNPELGLVHRTEVVITAGQVEKLKVDLEAVGEKM